MNGKYYGTVGPNRDGDILYQYIEDAKNVKDAIKFSNMNYNYIYEEFILKEGFIKLKLVWKSNEVNNE